MEKNSAAELVDWLADGGFESLGFAIWVGLLVYWWIDTGNIITGVFAATLLIIPVGIALLISLLPVAAVLEIFARR
ncbi:MAG: hypothetical protein LBU43_13060 [Candidatus Accumulibacter sp.]|jgi:hypothetical protein|nr:hypothetical protein [Accumulibacter sp.]